MAQLLMEDGRDLVGAEDLLEQALASDPWVESRKSRHGTGSRVQGLGSMALGPGSRV